MGVNVPNVVLNNGNKMPMLGLGVFRVTDPKDAQESVRIAIVNGYRSIDTAMIYENEVGVGEGIRLGIKDAGISREELFITSKLWNNDMRNDRVEEAYAESLKKLGLDYLDLYLIHWPVEDKLVSSWKVMEDLYKAGKIKNIGVSNFQVKHLQMVMDAGTVKPVINQIEYHPFLTQEVVKDFCEQNDIQVEAWSPLMNGDILKNDVINKLADKYDKSSAQIVLKWDVQTGVITIPKSSNEGRIKENINIFDFEMTNEDIAEISELNEDHRIGPDPDSFDF